MNNDKSKLELLPTSPGCYIHKDKNGTIIYGGRPRTFVAAVLFQRSHDNGPEALVSEIVGFEFIVTSPILRPYLRSTWIKENAQYNITQGR